jgi:acetyl esterase/lipase
MIFLLLLIHHLMLPVQDGIPRDTSFTLSGTAEKVSKQYPNAQLVFPTHPKDVTVEKDLVYSSHGERKLHLDIFQSRIKTLQPAVVLIHGGGWRSGERIQNNTVAERLAERGYVAVSVEYRLSIEALYPSAVYDLKAAIRWLRANSAKEGIDSTKIAVMGFSAGGQLAALLGTTNEIPKFEGSGGSAGHLSAIQAVVDVDGILDFTDPAESGKDTIPGKPSAGSYWFGGPMREKRDLWVEASPLVHVDKKSAPIVFINSSQARFHAGRDSMIQKLNSLRIYSEVHTFPDTPHPFWLFHPWFEPTCDFAVQFLDKVFGKKTR